MFSFNLPASTRVNKPIPKSAFDKYTNWRQKKNFTDKVSKIIWLNKLSSETTNLPFKEISEIQLITIELKHKTNIDPLLRIIDKAISYHILFTVEFQHEIYFSVAKKHPHPLNDDTAVIDWVFSSEWHTASEPALKLSLAVSIDSVFLSLCNQLSDPILQNKQLDLNTLIKTDSEISKLQLEIAQLSTQIKNEKQFNKKVELNTKLNALKRLKDSLNNP